MLGTVIPENDVKVGLKSVQALIDEPATNQITVWNCNLHFESMPLTISMSQSHEDTGTGQMVQKQIILAFL